MNWAHLHLALNHLPVIGSLLVALLLVCAMVKRSEEILRLGLWWTVALTLASIPIKFTGDFASESLGKLEGREAELIEAHEQAADQATTGIFLAGVIAGVALFQARKGRALPRWGAIATLALLLATFALMARTANLGGQIRHPEIRRTE